MNDIQLLQDIRTELQTIRAHSEAQSNLISNASTYGIGYAIAFGMNMGTPDPNIIGAALVSLLSWINVGYCLIQHLAK